MNVKNGGPTRPDDDTDAGLDVDPAKDRKSVV